MITTIAAIVRGDQAIFPPYLYEAYRSTIRRAPSLPLVDVPLTLSELTGPGPAISAVTPEDADLTRNSGTGGEAIGQRIIVTGRVLDAQGAPVPHTLVEVWQANAAGRYIHQNDQWPGPLDPNFLGIGRCRTDADGVYRFLTIRPGAYPWKNHAECLATGAYPLLAVWPDLGCAPDHADVFRRRPAAGARPDLQLHPDRAGAAAFDR